MPRHSIDYLNARRDAKPASGGKRYAVTRNAADDKAQWKAADAWEQALAIVDAIQGEFRSWSAATRQDVEMLMRGETFKDQEF